MKRACTAMKVDLLPLTTCVLPMMQTSKPTRSRESLSSNFSSNFSIPPGCSTSRSSKRVMPRYLACRCIVDVDWGASD